MPEFDMNKPPFIPRAGSKSGSVGEINEHVRELESRSFGRTDSDSIQALNEYLSTEDSVLPYAGALYFTALNEEGASHKRLQHINAAGIPDVAQAANELDVNRYYSADTLFDILRNDVHSAAESRDPAARRIIDAQAACSIQSVEYPELNFVADPNYYISSNSFRQQLRELKDPEAGALERLLEGFDRAIYDFAGRIALADLPKIV